MWPFASAMQPRWIVCIAIRVMDPRGRVRLLAGAAPSILAQLRGHHRSRAIRLIRPSRHGGASISRLVTKESRSGSGHERSGRGRTVRVLYNNSRVRLARPASRRRYLAPRGLAPLLGHDGERRADARAACLRNVTQGSLFSSFATLLCAVSILLWRKVSATPIHRYGLTRHQPKRSTLKYAGLTRRRQ